MKRLPFCHHFLCLYSVTGDLFKDNLPEADLYILCHVIENWKDDKCNILLKKAFDWLPAGTCIRKPTICMGENKDADQLRGNREADQRLCFRYTDSTFPPLLIP